MMKGARPEAFQQSKFKTQDKRQSIPINKNTVGSLKVFVSDRYGQNEG
tara:strand:+ start:1125 stop:1268 length:144 start_codon:yes stop_codon:yes gene_type:complete